MFNQRLKLARRGAGLSLRGLADKIGQRVSAQAIGKYERGEMMPSSDIALELARALDVPLDYLFAPSGLELQQVEFRKTHRTTAKERSSVEAQVVDQLDRYLLVEEFLGLQSERWNKPSWAPVEVTSLDESEATAGRLREFWDLGVDPIPDMTELLESQGIKVIQPEFPLSMDGLCCFLSRPGKEQIPVILASSTKSVERKRLTLAHEVGHFLMRFAGDVQPEKACHRFAAAFLVPASSLLAEIGQKRTSFGYMELIALKHLYGVSAAALVMRFRDLRIISPTAAEAIFRGVGRGWRKQEPSPSTNRTESPARFERLVIAALAEDLISLPKAAEMLRRTVSEVRSLLAGPAVQV